MSGPYVPAVLAAPAYNPQVGSTGAPPIPYISVSEYQFAPTAMSIKSLNPGGSTSDQFQVLADTIRRASQWADNICFGADPSNTGASLAASLSIESANARVAGGQLILICDYKPILQLVGCDVGPNPFTLTSIGALSEGAEFGRRTITVPFWGLPMRSGDTPPPWFPGQMGDGRVYAVWSYVAGFPHTTLVDDVAQGATSCVVDATDGSGGLYGVFAASGAFPGSQLTLYDGAASETVFVTGITTGSTTTTLTTTAFQNAHTVPEAPDFIPVSGVPADVHQAVISLTTMLIKTRGARAMEMPRIPGAMPKQKWQNDQVISQAGAMEDFEIAQDLLTPYMTRLKSKY